MNLRKITFLFCLAVLLTLTACQPSEKKNNVFLLVDFKPQESIKYKLVSERHSSVILDSKSNKTKPELIDEKLEMVISYKPVGEPDPYGLTMIEATCHSAKVTRKAKINPRKDAVELLAGRTYRFTVTPIGKIVEFADLDKLAAELGSKAIVTSGRQGSIKEPDMIADFVTMQWFLWDSISTSNQATSGIVPGASWTAKQYIPLPVPVGFIRDTKYSIALEGNQYSAKGELEKVIIDSVYSVGDGVLKKWPKIYTGTFGMKGTCGILRKFKLTSIKGTGRQVFDLERGVLEKDVQQYKAKVSAVFMFPLAGISPELTVDQKMSIELIE